MKARTKAAGREAPKEISIEDRISRAYPGFTGALRTFADLVLAEPVEVARLSIHGAVQSAGVSVATANRFARAIGFSGYAEFRAELIRGFRSAFAPVERMRSEISRHSTSLEICQAALEEDIRNLQATIGQLKPEVCDRAVELIVSAERSFIVGIDNSAHLASLMAAGLDRYRGNVRSVSSADGALGAARQIFRFGPKDLLIAIAFPRYFRDTVELARFAVDRGVPLLAITDGPKSPLAAIAEAVIYVNAGRQFAATSDTAVLSVIEALSTAVAHRSPHAADIEEEFAAFAVPWFEPDYGEKQPATPSRGEARTKRRNSRNGKESR